eukprot:gene4187-6533_t
MAGFMNRKDFHPSNFQNQKRRFAAEQAELARRRKEKELQDELNRERSEFQSMAFHALPKEQADVEKGKYMLSFMYDVPPDVTAEKPKALDTSQLSYREQKALPLAEKLDFLKNAPRQEHARQLEAFDKPFGKEVRNVRCFRCGKWGHQHTDRTCPLFGKARLGQEGEAERNDFEDPAVLMRKMREDGLVLSRTVLGRQNDPSAPNQQLLEDSDDPEGNDLAFLSSLSRKEKKRLLKTSRQNHRHDSRSTMYGLTNDRSDSDSERS